VRSRPDSAGFAVCIVSSVIHGERERERERGRFDPARKSSSRVSSRSLGAVVLFGGPRGTFSRSRNGRSDRIAIQPVSFSHSGFVLSLSLSLSR